MSYISDVLWCVLISSYLAGPGPVPSLNFTVVSAQEITVKWSPVAEEDSNGVLVSYTITLAEYGGQQLANRSLNTSSILEATFTGLGQCKHTHIG